MRAKLQGLFRTFWESRRYRLISAGVIGVLLIVVAVAYLAPPKSKSASSPGDAGQAADSTDASASADIQQSAAAEGAAGQAGTNPGAGSAGSAGHKNTASDVGVTPTTIKVGILRPNAPGDPPKPDPNSAAVAFVAFIKDINSKGGINGRIIQAVDEPFLPPNEADKTRACVHLTESEKVFAVLNEAYFDGKCIAVDHKTFLAQYNGVSDQEYQAAAGLNVSVGASAQRMLRNLVDALENRGEGIHNDHVVGTVEQSDAASQQQMEGLIGPLQSHGHAVVRSPIGGLPPDPAAISAAVTDQRSKGVTAVLLMTNLFIGPQFIQEANNQGFHPRYYTSDFNSLSQDALTGQMPPDGFNGAIGMTSTRTGEGRAGMPEPALDAACRTTFQKVTGKNLDRNSADYVLMERYCGLVQDFAAAAKLAGPDITRAKISSAYRSLGPHAFPFSGDISYGPNKLDGGDSQRAVRWHAGKNGCDSQSNGCYTPIDGSFSPYRV